MSVRITILNLLEHSIGNARDAISRAEIQLKRIPFDHDTRDSLESYKLWEQRNQEAIDYIRTHPEIP